MADWSGNPGTGLNAGGPFAIRSAYDFNPHVVSPGNPMRRNLRLDDFESLEILLMDLYERRDYVAHQSAPGWNIARADGSVHFAISRQAYEAMPVNPDAWESLQDPPHIYYHHLELLSEQ